MHRSKQTGFTIKTIKINKKLNESEVVYIYNHISDSPIQFKM